MRVLHRSSSAGCWVLGTLAVLAMSALAAPVYAEAPSVYDPLGNQAEYDPDLFPLNRSAGTVELLIQGWSEVDPAHPRGSVFNQDYTEQFRLRWFASLAPEYTLLVEGKASGKDHAVLDDYFLKTDLSYQGLSSPFIPYGGMRFSENDSWTAYFGLESLSHRTADVFNKAQNRAPVAYRGWMEVRFHEKGQPTLRLQGMAHSLPELVENMDFSVGLDTFFTEGFSPDWLAALHWDWEVTKGFGRIFTATGYEYNLRTKEQRASFGAGLRAF